MRILSAVYVAEMVAALKWGAKSKTQLVDFTGATEKFIENWLNEFHRSGLVYVHHTERLHVIGQSTNFYAWQPEAPFGLPDNHQRIKP